MYPLGAGAEVGGPVGDSYAVALVRDGEAAAVLEVLRRIRFTGWVGPAEGGWLPVIAVPGSGAVATKRRGIAGVGEALAQDLKATVLVLRVLADRQLAVVAWTGDEEVGRYVSDPSREPGAEEDVLDDPLGVSSADEFAEAAGHPERGGELAELLDEHLDPESVIESERLARMLRLLALPTWLVAVATLPRDIPTGPGARDLTRLGFGLPGPGGVIVARLARVLRRRRPPPPIIADPPQGSSGMDPWLM
ncbi:hypothetical protein OWR29_23885 [Actinoplanes sp. Pm04-4]|uniref:Uncharacterized protein n=1 Tax=Paractinoplanes pyxinae TaxID=2997416 RepID=A0ABT4B3J5_9ACTN|nr:hypothetical protein [Actinoplanes pyxinae]MCY1141050.1 hypothetical protein [Actinoplanes pyxinae]